jgi:hypothetical protein
MKTASTVVDPNSQGFLSILQSAAPLLQKARTLRLIEIRQQFWPNVDWLNCLAAVARYYAVSAEIRSDGTNRSGQEEFLATFREQIIQKQFRRFWMP